MRSVFDAKPQYQSFFFCRFPVLKLLRHAYPHRHFNTQQWCVRLHQIPATFQDRRRDTLQACHPRSTVRNGGFSFIAFAKWYLYFVNVSFLFQQPTNLKSSHIHRSFDDDKCESNNLHHFSLNDFSLDTRFEYRQERSLREKVVFFTVYNKINMRTERRRMSVALYV